MQAIPTKELAEAAIHEVPGVDSVLYRQVNPGVEFSYRIVRNPPWDQFSFRRGVAHGTLELQETDQGVKTLRLYAYWMNCVPPRKTLEDSRLLMDEVYARLRSHNPDLPPPEALEERWLGVNLQSESSSLFQRIFLGVPKE